MDCEVARRDFPGLGSDEHLASCEGCRSWVSRLNRAQAIAREVWGASPPDLAARVLARVQPARMSRDLPDRDVAAIPRPRTRASSRRIWRHAFVPLVAATVVVVVGTWFLLNGIAGRVTAPPSATGGMSSLDIDYAPTFKALVARSDVIVLGRAEGQEQLVQPGHVLLTFLERFRVLDVAKGSLQPGSVIGVYRISFAQAGFASRATHISLLNRSLVPLRVERSTSWLFSAQQARTVPSTTSRG